MNTRPLLLSPETRAAAQKLKAYALGHRPDNRKLLKNWDEAQRQIAQLTADFEEHKRISDAIIRNRDRVVSRLTADNAKLREALRSICEGALDFAKANWRPRHD